MRAADYKWDTKKFEPFPRGWWETIEVFPQLKGETWSDDVLGVLHALRPSAIRVTTGEVHTDHKLWRVTVFVDADMKITSIEQEVEVYFINDSVGVYRLAKKLSNTTTLGAFEINDRYLDHSTETEYIYKGNGVWHVAEDPIFFKKD